MDKFSTYDHIEAVSFHYMNGNSKLYTGQELTRLLNDLKPDDAPLFVVVNFINRDTPMVIYDVQESSSYIRSKF